QKQYETLRAVVIDKLPPAEAGRKFGYKVNTVNSLLRDVKRGKLILFPEVKTGPRQRRTSIAVQETIIRYRKKHLSSPDIHNRLLSDGIRVSVRTIERILTDSGFRKLKRRTNRELGKTRRNKLIPGRSAPLDFNKLEPFKIDCPTAGVFFLIPYIIKSGIVQTVKKCNLPGSNDISSVSACLSMLLLKLIGNKRLSHMDSYDHEPGWGIFARLNNLPKSTYMSTYSCLTSEKMLLEFQEEIISAFRKSYPHFYKSKFINLDFHSIPHYGSKAEMEKIWCGSRGKSIKGANTIFAQDSQSNVILYIRADILRKDEAKEVRKFVE
ncbi:hypothetical protein KA005_40420, partial [bacterium]|nr:hypothetical protein [bacterium]